MTPVDPVEPVAPVDPVEPVAPVDPVIPVGLVGIGTGAGAGAGAKQQYSRTSLRSRRYCVNSEAFISVYGWDIYRVRAAAAIRFLMYSS